MPHDALRGAHPDEDTSECTFVNWITSPAPSHKLVQKATYVTIAGGAGENEMLLCELLAELFAPFLACSRASSRNAILARQDMPNSGQNFTLCDALIATEGG
jgi:hypothetical protein